MRKTIDFLLYDWLEVESLCQQARFRDHSRDTFDSVLDMCERIAKEKFAPYNRIADTQEPRQEGDSVILPRSSLDAAYAYVESGMLAAVQDHEVGGMQLPYVVELAANVFFAKAGIGLGGGSMLTVGNMNLLMTYGTAAQKAVFAQKQMDGKWFGTMCLSEPQAGSSLSDILTRAVPDGADHAEDQFGPRYRLFGNKMWISNGEHDVSENIVHLVLAKIPDEHGRLPAGTRGISLFVVPKKLVDAKGQLTGVRNDVALAGLNHKMGYRGMPNTLLNFGEGRYPVEDRPGAVGYLIGRPGEGLKCMFHMMNEARIGVGLGAVGIGYAGYEASLDYARNRRQGRLPGPAGKDPASPPVAIIEHTDVRRMLLAQKAYVEGGLALELYCGRLVDECRTVADEQTEDRRLLLEILTPIAKSWPSEWCLEANNLAIQVHGGYGYTRDFPVEQFWRDNRLNMIHEGTHGIQALDLLGRKVLMDGGRALTVITNLMDSSAKAADVHRELKADASALDLAVAKLRTATRDAWSTGQPLEALANATPYMQAFGHIVLAWLWLDLARASIEARASATRSASLEFYQGKLQASRYFFDFELPRVDAWLAVAGSRNSTCLEMRNEWFES
jgi:butyryl-CoA dehydrogenase